MPESPSVVVFDVNETLSDMRPMAVRFAAAGVPETMAQLWFASLLRDGFALTAAGGFERFSALAEDGLRQLLRSVSLELPLDDAVTNILSGFFELPVHADVVDGVRGLRAAGRRLVTLTNGATQVAEALLDRANLGREFERLLSVEDVGEWKPAPGAYQCAVQACGVKPGEMVLVSVHPWDIHGARNAGLLTAWVNRDASRYPSYFTEPTYEIATIGDLTAELDR